MRQIQTHLVLPIEKATPLVGDPRQLTANQNNSALTKAAGCVAKPDGLNRGSVTADFPACAAGNTAKVSRCGICAQDSIFGNVLISGMIELNELGPGIYDRQCGTRSDHLFDRHFGRR